MKLRPAVLIAGCGVLVLVVIVSWLLGCNGNVPSADDVSSHLRTALPAYVELVDCKIEYNVLPGGQVEARFRAQCRAGVDLFELVSDSLQPGCRMVSRVQVEAEEWDLFGSINATRYGDRWQFTQPRIQSGLNQIGKPREDFPGARLYGSAQDLPPTPDPFSIEQAMGDGVAVLRLTWSYDLQASPATRFAIERRSVGAGQWHLIEQGTSNTSYVDSLFCNGDYSYRLFAVENGCRSQGIVSSANEVRMSLGEWLMGYWPDIDVNDFQNGNFTLNEDSGIIRFPNSTHPSNRMSRLAELSFDSAVDTTVSFVRVKDGSRHQQYVGYLHAFEDSIVILGDPQRSHGINYNGTLRWKAKKP